MNNVGSNINNNVELFMEILNNITDLVFFINVDKNKVYRYIYINQQAISYLNLNESPVGKTIHEVMPQNIADLIVKQYEEAIKSKTCITYEDDSFIWGEGLKTQNGLTLGFRKHKFFESKVSPFIDMQNGSTYIVAIVRDITDRKIAEMALRDSEEKYRLIADNMSDLVSILDINGLLKYASPSYEFVLGYPPEKYAGKSAFDFVHPDEVSDMRSRLEDLILKKTTSTVEFRHRHTNGTWVWVEGKASAILDENDNVVHVLMVARDIRERIEFEQKLKKMAYHDSLTGLPNRRLFIVNLAQALNQIDITGETLAVMYMDIDKFKSVNDTLGHDAGDELLTQFAKRVKSCLRKNDVLARFGGDEFCILILIDNKEEASTIATRILEALQVEWDIHNCQFNTTSSIGIAFYEPDQDINTVIKNADIALFRAKEKGRNNYQFFDNCDDNIYYI